MMKRILSILLALCSLFSVAILPLTAADGVEVVTESIESTTAYEDLSKATIKGLPINMDFRYPLKTTASEDAFELITLVEVGYKQGVGANSQTDYALYAYVYYPRGTRLITASTKHTITLATAFEKTNAAGELQTNPADWSATAYDQFTMTLVNLDETAATGVGKYPIYKFKVNATAADLQAGFNDAGRRYDISRVDLHFRNTTAAKDFTVGQSFVCSGYRANETYKMDASTFEAVEIEVEQTHYRFDNKSSLDQKTQISTVYFALDQDFIDRWDQINAITARWFEAHSTPMVMTSDQALYEEYMGITKNEYSTTGIKYIGKDLTNLPTDKLPERTISTYERYLPGTSGAYVTRYYWQYNSVGPHAQQLTASDLPLVGNCNKLAWFLPYPMDAKTDASKWGQSLVDASISTEELQEYYKTYLQEDCGWGDESTWNNNLLYTTGLVVLRGVDEGREYGWQTHTIRDPIKVEGFEYGSGLIEWWNRLYLGYRDEKIDPIDPIQVVNSAHFYEGKELMGDEELGLEYLVAEQDITAFKNFCTKAFAQEQTVICFHFAATEYYSAPLGILCTHPITGVTMYENLANVSQQTLFFDFTVLDFHCVKDGEEVVIPVVSNTIDAVVGDYDSSDNIGDPGPKFDLGIDDFLSDLKSTFAIIMGLLVIVIVVILVLNLIGPAAQVTGAVGRGISSAAKGVGSAFKRRNRRK